MTSGGILELTKGCYIALMRKRKNIKKQGKKEQKKLKQLPLHEGKENLNTSNISSSCFL